MCNYQNEIKYFEHVFSFIQDKVQTVEKGTGQLCHGGMLQLRDFGHSELAKNLRIKGIMTTINIKLLNAEEPQETGTISGL